MNNEDQDLLLYEVVASGLPPLPDELGDQPIPIAMWSTGDHLAVITVATGWMPAGLNRIGYSLHLRRRTDNWWETPEFGTGAGWPWPTVHRPETFGDREVRSLSSGFHSNGTWVIGEIEGIAGSAARSLRVTSASEVVERPVRHEVGWWVAAWDGTEPARVELLDAEGTVLLDQKFEGHQPF